MALPRAVWLAGKGLKAAVYMFFLFFTALVGCPLYQILGLFVFYPFSRSLWRNFNTMFIEWWHTLMLIFIELWIGIKFFITGDEIPKAERALIICNHPSETDWLLFLPLAYRKGMIGNMKVVLKKDLRYVPGLGQALDSLDWLFLARDWEADKPTFVHRLRTWVEDQYRLWLFFFPEGTDFTPGKQVRSVAYAKEHNLPQFKHVLLPRTTGFTTALTELRPGLDAVYDVTLAYPGARKPNPLTCIMGIAPKAVHANIKRYAIGDLPKEEEGMKKWLYDRFQEKDDLIETYKAEGKFPPGKNGSHTLAPPVHLYIWGIWWFLMALIWIYWIGQSRLVLGFLIVGNIVQTVRTFSTPFRKWCGLVAPDDFVVDAAAARKKTN